MYKECDNSILCFFRETTDTYTIAASPSFGYLGPSTSKYSLLDLGRSGLGSDLKLPLVSDNADGKQDSVKTLPKTLGSIRDERVSFHLQHTGEVYISQGCNVTQTVFNGNYHLNTKVLKLHTYYQTCLIFILLFGRN
jgi:vesicular inhibitory amino acid transporter